MELFTMFRTQIMQNMLKGASLGLFGAFRPEQTDTLIALMQSQQLFIRLSPNALDLQIAVIDLPDLPGLPLTFDKSQIAFNAEPPNAPIVLTTIAGPGPRIKFRFTAPGWQHLSINPLLLTGAVGLGSSVRLVPLSRGPCTVQVDVAARLTNATWAHLNDFIELKIVSELAQRDFPVEV